MFIVSLQRMLTKTQAIVLHSLKYGETRLIVDMFTRSQGRQSFIVSIPKSVKGKIKKQLFQPLTLLEIESDLRPKLQLQKLSDVRLASPFSSIPFDPNKLSISLFIAEFLYYALRSEQHNEPLFDYIVNSIQWLDAQTDRFANFHLVFLMRLSRFLGFYPNLDHYQTGDYFDLRESVFLSTPPVHRDFLHPQEAEKIQLMMRMDFPTMHLFRMSHQERNRLLEVSLIYYRLHLPDFPELKSVSVLQELYQ
jgi:DNA repair protein RecO (recombination protein O)